MISPSPLVRPGQPSKHETNPGGGTDKQKATEMEEYRLDNELERIYAKLPFLWNEYNFHVKYITRDYGIYYRGFIIGLENKVCRLVFQKETNSPVEPIRDYVGTNSHHLHHPNILILQNMVGTH